MTSTSDKKPATRSSPARNYGGLSEQERIVERRERFLAAGLEIFGTVGIGRATVRALCRAAGLTERYFYESFVDTEALYCAVYNQQLAAIQQFFMTELPRLPSELEAKVHAALDLYFTLMRNDRTVRVLYLESLAGSPDVVAMHHNNTEMYIQVVVQFIRIDNPGLDLSDDFLQGVAHAVNGACTSMVVQWMHSGYRIDQETVRNSCALVVLGIMRELRTRASAAEAG